MARPDTYVAARYRSIHRFEGIYDVGLAASFDSDGAMDKFPLYRRIGKAINALGKRPFLPHEVVGREWKPERVYDIVNRIAIPGCDLVLFYAEGTDIAIADAGMMLQRALHSGIPVIGFYERGREDGIRDVKIRGAKFLEEICFANEDEAIERLTGSMRRFYASTA